MPAAECKELGSPLASGCCWPCLSAQRHSKRGQAGMSHVSCCLCHHCPLPSPGHTESRLCPNPTPALWAKRSELHTGRHPQLGSFFLGCRGLLSFNPYPCCSSGSANLNFPLRHSMHLFQWPDPALCEVRDSCALAKSLPPFSVLNQGAANRRGVGSR